MLYNIMPENLSPQLSTAPSMSQESFNIEMVRKYYQDIANLKEKYIEKQRKYKNAYNRLLHASTGASTVGVVSGVSTIGMAFTIVGLPISASLGVVSTVSTCVGACLLLTSKMYKKKLLKCYELLDKIKSKPCQHFTSSSWPSTRASMSSLSRQQPTNKEYRPRLPQQGQIAVFLWPRPQRQYVKKQFFLKTTKLPGLCHPKRFF